MPQVTLSPKQSQQLRSLQINGNALAAVLSNFTTEIVNIDSLINNLIAYKLVHHSVELTHPWQWIYLSNNAALINEYEQNEFKSVKSGLFQPPEQDNLKQPIASYRKFFTVQQQTAKEKQQQRAYQDTLGKHFVALQQIQQRSTANWRLRDAFYVLNTVVETEDEPEAKRAVAHILLGKLYTKQYHKTHSLADGVEAYSHFLKAKHLGSIEADAMLGLAYQEGIGTSVHIPVALALYFLGACNHDETALAHLKNQQENALQALKAHRNAIASATEDDDNPIIPFDEETYFQHLLASILLAAIPGEDSVNQITALKPYITDRLQQRLKLTLHAILPHYRGLVDPVLEQFPHNAQAPSAASALDLAPYVPLTEAQEKTFVSITEPFDYVLSLKPFSDMPKKTVASNTEHLNALRPLKPFLDMPITLALNNAPAIKTNLLSDRVLLAARTLHKTAHIAPLAAFEKPTTELNHRWCIKFIEDTLDEADSTTFAWLQTQAEYSLFLRIAPIVVFCAAARIGDDATLNALLSIDEVMDAARTVLSKSLVAIAAGGNLDVLNRLLDYPEVANTLRTANGEYSNFGTALRAAAEKGHFNIVNRLLQFNTPPVTEVRALVIAAVGGHRDIVNRLLACYPNERQNHVLTQALKAAARGGQLALVEHLMSYEDRPDDEDIYPELLQDAASSYWGPLNLVNDFLDHETLKNNTTALSQALEHAIAHLPPHLDIIKRLLECKEVIINAETFNTKRWNGVLSDAIREGRLDVIERLFERDIISKHFAALYDKILPVAADYGQLDIVNYFLKFEAMRKNDTALNEALVHAAGNGHLRVVNRLLEFASIHKPARAALVLAAENGQVAVVNRLMDFHTVSTYGANSNTSLPLYDAHETLTAAADALTAAAEQGHLDVVNRLALEKFQFNPPNWLKYAVEKAAKNGHLHVIKRLLAFKVLKGKDLTTAMSNAVEQGHIDIVNHLLKFGNIPSEYTQSNISFLVNHAAKNGHHVVVERLLQFTREQMHPFSTGDIIREVASKGYLLVLEQLLEFERTNNLNVNHAASLHIAAANGHLDIVNRLLELPGLRNRPNEFITALSCARGNLHRENPGYLSITAHGPHPLVIKRLLRFPSVFNYAEQHVFEFGEFVKSFIREQLAQLEIERSDWQDTHGDEVFDVTSEQAPLYFLLMRNAIRQQSPEGLAILNQLLEIPAVRALAHTSLTELDNELLRLAVRIGNIDAIVRLTRIPAVRALAQRNNFYQEEAQGRVDLRAIAQNRESSMVALSVDEEKLLAAATKRYAEKIEEAGGALKVFDDMVQHFQEEYNKAPAFIMVDNQKVSLPLTYAEFAEMDLPDKSVGPACTAYYQHPLHTAIRYLSRPNYWMHPEAEYVNVEPDDTDLRFSTFEEYRNLIAVLWYAASDPNIGVGTEFPADKRIVLFIAELALLGRAHNWDQKRYNPKTKKYEEYDDLDDDRPSCYSGVKRRLFQSVIGHPDLTIFTADDLKVEIYTFIFAYYKELLKNNEKDLTLLRAAMQALDDDEPYSPLVATLNIPTEKKEAFKQELLERYGASLRTNASLLKILDERLVTKPDQPDFIRYSYFANLKTLLNPIEQEAEQKSAVTKESAPRSTASTSATSSTSTSATMPTNTAETSTPRK